MFLSRQSRSIIWFFFLLFCFFIHAPGLEAQEPIQAWKFAVISDTQGNNRENNSKSCINDGVVSAIAEDIAREKPDFVLVAGDLVNGWFKNGGTDYAVQYANWKKAVAPVYRAGIRVYPIRGNHDSGPERIALPPLPAHLEPPADTPLVLKKVFREAFPEAYIPKNGPNDEISLTYSFFHKNAFIIGLDQFTGGQHKVNQEWLDKQLVTSENRHIFIFGHEPAFETGHKDNLAFYREARDRFWDSIGKTGGRIYFCGHDHFYNRALISDSNGNGIWQIIAGTGGGGLRTWSGVYGDSNRVKGEYHNNDHHGYVLVIIDGPKVSVSWKALVKQDTLATWQILDEFSYSDQTRKGAQKTIQRPSK